MGFERQYASTFELWIAVVGWFVVMAGNTTRRAPLWFSLAFVVLAISVFSWGLGYKLSLYNASPSSFHRVPTATLLSGDEQNTSDHTILRGDFSGVPPVQVELAMFMVLPFAVLALMSATVKQQEQDTADSSLNRRVAALNSFFFRPPPQIYA